MYIKLLSKQLQIWEPDLGQADIKERNWTIERTVILVDQST
jgi:hypothetical protein